MQHSFSLTTYNILAEAYALPERYAGAERGALDPVARKRRILHRLRDLDTDLFCLQEVEPDMARAIGKALPSHVMHYEQKHGKPDGIATLFRESLWECQDIVRTHYEDARPGHDQTGLILVLAREDRTLVVANTHLRWQPSEIPRAEHEGLGQFRSLMQALPEGTCVIAGDLNEDSDGPVLEEARRMGLRMSAPLGNTAIIDGVPRRLDYVLHSAATLLPTPRPLPELRAGAVIPSTEEPSDHVPLCVDITWAGA